MAILPIVQYVENTFFCILCIFKIVLRQEDKYFPVTPSWMDADISFNYILLSKCKFIVIKTWVEL